MNKTMISALGASALLVVGLAVPATAQSQDQSSNRSERTRAADAGNPNQRICVQYTLTGSRMPKRDCRTRREWERDGGVPTSED